MERASSVKYPNQVYTSKPEIVKAKGGEKGRKEEKEKKNVDSECAFQTAVWSNFPSLYSVYLPLQRIHTKTF